MCLPSLLWHDTEPPCLIDSSCHLPSRWRIGPRATATRPSSHHIFGAANCQGLCKEEGMMTDRHRQVMTDGTSWHIILQKMTPPPHYFHYNLGIYLNASYNRQAFVVLPYYIYTQPPLFESDILQYELGVFLLQQIYGFNMSMILMFHFNGADAKWWLLSGLCLRNWEQNRGNLTDITSDWVSDWHSRLTKFQIPHYPFP